MCKLYKNGMNNTQKKMMLIGGILMLLSYSTLSTTALNRVVRPHIDRPTLGEEFQLNYYILNLGNSKNISNWLGGNVASPATLNNEEFVQMKIVLQKSITRYNRKARGNPDFLIKGLYGVQYLPYIDKKGQKQIWINGFCGDDAKPQNPAIEVIFAFDGGSSFFNATIRAGSSKPVSVGIHGFA